MRETERSHLKAFKLWKTCQWRFNTSWTSPEPLWQTWAWASLDPRSGSQTFKQTHDHTVNWRRFFFWQFKAINSCYKRLSVHHRITHQSSQLHRNWKLLKWWENQLISLEIKKEMERDGMTVKSQTSVFQSSSKRKCAVKLPVCAGGVHGVQSHVQHLCGLGQLTGRCWGKISFHVETFLF